jgi:hypothetical protein
MIKEEIWRAQEHTQFNQLNILFDHAQRRCVALGCGTAVGAGGGDDA